MDISGDKMRLPALMSEQYDDLVRAVRRLEQAARLVPTVDEAAWQGPARFAYDGALGRLRRSLSAAIDELRTARDQTQSAVQSLQR